MNISYSTEISLRAAIISAKKLQNPDETFSETIKKHALNQLELVQKVEDMMKGIKNADNTEKAAIGAAINALELAYKAISFGLEETKLKRRQFSEECDKHLATFAIDNNKEPQEFSTEELAIKQFYNLLISRDEEFVDYCGIQVIKRPEHPNVDFYSILPYYRMSQALPQNNLIASRLDQLRQGIYLFLKTGLPLKAYFTKYQNASSVVMHYNSFMQPSNFLNNYRAPRFIITALANLLWNMQHPVSTSTGLPLNLSEAVSLCYDVEMFLNDLLNPAQYPYIEPLDTKSKRLNQCLLNIEVFIKSLRRSFEFERLHEINLRQVSQHMHSGLKVMSNKLLELIYHNEEAAEIIVGQMMTISSLVVLNPQLYNYFYSYQISPLPPHINIKPTTAIDLLVIYAHLTPFKRKQICKTLIASDLEPEIQLAFSLRQLHLTSLEPFEDVSLKQLAAHAKTEAESYRISAAYFLPVIFLVMESFAVFRDTRPHLSANETLFSNGDDLQHLYDIDGTLSDKIQRQNILADACVADDKSYYHWSITMFFQNKSKTHQHIDQLLVWQNEMRLKTLELDRYTDRIEENRIWLQFPAFQQELINFLSDITYLYRQLKDKFCSIETEMQSNNKINRDEKRVLQPMLDDLEVILESTQKSISQVNSVISDPDFCEYEREKFYEKNSAISPQQNKVSPMLQSRAYPPARSNTAASVNSATDDPDFDDYEKESIDEKNSALSHQQNKVSLMLQSRAHIPAISSTPAAMKQSGVLVAGRLGMTPVRLRANKPESTTNIPAPQPPEKSKSSHLGFYLSITCSAITSLALASNLIYPMFNLTLAQNILALMVSLTISIALLAYNYYKKDGARFDFSLEVIPTI